MNHRPTARAALLVLAAIGLVGGSAAGHDARHGATAPPDRGAPAPIRTTMEGLHAHGGVPPGWAFAIPAGSAPEGRRVFRTLECFACHAVRGEDFPRASRARESAGPELTGMGAHHPPEYFAESILNPNRVIVLGPGYTGPDGLSTMPNYADTMTLQQLMDVVAYLVSLTGSNDATPTPGGSMHRH
jgi:mono/diheme cytochrome c family protein